MKKKILLSCLLTLTGITFTTADMTEYVPTTIFVDGNGNILSNAPVIGANDYDSWVEYVNRYL